MEPSNYKRTTKRNMPEGIYFFKFTFVLDSVLFLKLLVFRFLLSVAETLLCSLSALRGKIVIQLLMLFTGTLIYLKPKLFCLIKFYTRHILAGAIVLIELLLLPKLFCFFSCLCVCACLFPSLLVFIYNWPFGC